MEEMKQVALLKKPQNFERSKERIRETHHKEIEGKENALGEAQEKIEKLMKKVERLELENMKLKAEVKNSQYIKQNS